MTSSKQRGRPGPAITIGIPAVLAAFAGSWGYAYLEDTYFEDSDASGANVGVDVPAAPATAAEPTTFKVAADPWSGYSTFRNEQRFTTALAKQGVTLSYLDEEKYYDQNERLRALAAGEIDLALTTLDAFLQFGAKHLQNGQYPGAIIFGIDESAGGDAIFLSRARKSFDDVKPTDAVCYAAGTPSEHLWDFASLSFAALNADLPSDLGVVAKDCWEKLEKGAVQVAVLWQPYTALAEKAGYPKVFSTGGQADDLIVDVAVANRAVIEGKRRALGQLVAAYFKTIDGYSRDPAAHAALITGDCGADCAADLALGAAVLDGIDFLGLQENLCLWFGLCDAPGKLVPRVGKTARLLVAKNKLDQNLVPQAQSIIEPQFLAALREEQLEATRLARSVVGPDSREEPGPASQVKDAEYDYTVPGAEGAPVGTLRMPNVAFPEASYMLTPEAKQTVSIIAETLRSFPALCVRIAGHTNSTGDAQANRTLSRLRAMAIGTQLTRLDPKAFPKERFDVQGHGSERPVLVDGREDKAASRRTEFTLYTCGEGA
jgi:outer membrane protein OmpA-like peptidoglycan-associated protein